MEVRLAAASLTSITCACTLHLAHGKRTSGSAAAAESGLTLYCRFAIMVKDTLKRP